MKEMFELLRDLLEALDPHIRAAFDEDRRFDAVAEEYREWIQNENRQFRKNMAGGRRSGTGPKKRKVRTEPKARATWRTILDLPSGPLANGAVKQAFRSALMKAHPDHGGSTQATQRVLWAREQARKAGFSL